MIVMCETRAQLDNENVKYNYMQYAIIIHINYLSILCTNNAVNTMYFKSPDLL